jgi:phosphoribosyl 1,2-cyclic phosphodiesterase
VLRLCSLGSGSSGNALVVEATDGLATTRVLIDNGFNLRQLGRRLERAGLGIEALDAVFVTHEHSDHSAGVAVLARRHHVPVYCTSGTASACGFDDDAAVRWMRIAAGDVVDIGALRVAPYAVPHDAGEPVQYTFSDGARRAGLLTDAGECSQGILDALVGLHALVLECNHDPLLLQRGTYPVFLKQRIAGALGHLSNDQAAGILQAIDCRQLSWVAAAHLSAANNRPELARRAVSGVLGCDIGDVPVLDQAAGLDWRDV